MSLLFDRKYLLTVGKPDNIVTFSNPAPLVDGFTNTGWQSGTDWLKSTTKDAAEITDLQLETSIKGTSNDSKSASATTIKIYNLSTFTRHIVERINNYVILQAGYEQDPELNLIFSGQVSNFETVREGQNLVTTLYCTDAYAPDNSVRVSKKFVKGQTWGDVLKYLIDAYSQNGVPLGDYVADWSSAIDHNSRIDTGTGDLLSNIITAEASPQNYVQLPVIKKRPANTILINGYSMIGFLSQALEKVCKQIGYVSYITNGRLFIHPKGFTKTIEQFEFNTDQIKSIRKIGMQTTNSSVGTGIEGIKIVTFLDGRLDIDKRIKILDGEYAASYKIITKEHRINYEVGGWDTIITCKEDAT
jgi:hypothetical protein